MKILSLTKRLCSIVLLAACGLSSTVSAANFPYNYLEVRVPLSPGGLGGAYSQQFHENAHMIFEAESTFEDDWHLGGGVGFNAPVNQFTDLTGQLKLLSIKNKESDTGEFDKKLGRFATELNFTLHAWILPQLETGATLGVITAEEDYNLFSVFARLHTSDAFSMGAEFKVSGIEDNQFVVSVRYPF
ncbi:hypothetical protein C942_00910 [Photobacterium marinum]|uniref:Outer membrane protein beta-barrel domain-containing protein n=1 Tax=Photobacterium marinum TaxID=1056511 RepID=L8JC45_9GAMM|nr:hypothetical protein [Photobacterium marinum]ELR65823.1 hypothetical protein C942_00910 [Photobacterium marinum]